MKCSDLKISERFLQDLMHGIGIVEDSDHVHENVIYTKGKCQMPFTELGPPKTGALRSFEEL